MKTVFVLGGDGFIGWPTVLKFATNGYRVVSIDNLSRSDKHIPYKRVQAHENIYFYCIDVAREPEALKSVFEKYRPDHIIHLAEQRSAPHSMLNRRYTVDNNIRATHNILDMVRHSNCNIVHIGSMGVFGYDGEYSFNPGSVYHMTKCMDSIMFDYYNSNWNVCVTDLHQGIVWGWETDLTRVYGSNRFDYDGIYGTVLNRFLFQAANGIPLSVYGSGNRERAFIHLEDSVDALYNAAISRTHGTHKLFTEVLNLKDLANLISRRYNASIEYLENPRNEFDTNTLPHTPDISGTISLNSIHLDEIVASLAEKAHSPRRVNNSPKWDI